jgi:hypothetical protein
MAKTHDHEVVSIYPFTDSEIDAMMNNAAEAVLMWSTKDGWPVGVIHAFVWHEEKIWITFATHRHRTKAIRRDNRVSVAISSASYPPGSSEDLPTGGITFKGTGEFFDDEEIKHDFYTALASKVSGGSEAVKDSFYDLLNSPLRTVLVITPVKKIMYNGGLANRHIAGQVDESELGDRLSSDAQRMNKEREKRGLDPR